MRGREPAVVRNIPLDTNVAVNWLNHADFRYYPLRHYPLCYAPRSFPVAREVGLTMSEG